MGIEKEEEKSNPNQKTKKKAGSFIDWFTFEKNGDGSVTVTESKNFFSVPRTVWWNWGRRLTRDTIRRRWIEDNGD